MKDAVNAGVKEIVAGPATLLVYALTTVGVILALVSGQDSSEFQAFLDIVGKIDILVGALAGSRAVAVAGKAIGTGKTETPQTETPVPPTA